MSMPVPSPSMNGMIGSFGTLSEPSAFCVTEPWLGDVLPVTRRPTPYALRHTATAKAMPWSVLPASGGLHFRCNGKAAPAEPATCSNGILLATLDAKGKATSYTKVSDTQIPS